MEQDMDVAQPLTPSDTQPTGDGPLEGGEISPSEDLKDNLTNEQCSYFLPIPNSATSQSVVPSVITDPGYSCLTDSVNEHESEVNHPSQENITESTLPFDATISAEKILGSVPPNGPESALLAFDDSRNSGTVGFAQGDVFITGLNLSNENICNLEDGSIRTGIRGVPLSQTINTNPIISIPGFLQNVDASPTGGDCKDVLSSTPSPPSPGTTQVENRSMPGHGDPLASDPEAMSASLTPADGLDITAYPVSIDLYDTPLQIPPSCLSQSFPNLPSSTLAFPNTLPAADHLTTPSFSLVTDQSIAYDSLHVPSSPRPSVPSSSPPRIFSSSPLASSQSSELAASHTKEDLDDTPHSKYQRDLDSSHASPFFPGSLHNLEDMIQRSSPVSTTEPKFSPDIQIDVDDRKENLGVDDVFVDETTDPISALPSVIPLKRKRSEVLITNSPIKEHEKVDSDIPVLKSIQPGQSSPGSRQMPTTRRPTVASQKLQHKKLTAPFRSPLTKGVPAIATQSPAVKKIEADSVFISKISDTASTTMAAGPVATRVRTKRAAAQFKSPLAAGSAGSTGGPSSVRLTPTIQALESKIQLLKRAVKVKKEGEEEMLEKLVKKWKEAGREVAYELWGYLKDSGDGRRNDWGAQQGNWSWEEAKEEMRPVDDTGELETQDQRERDDGSEEYRAGTIGTMLRQLGIAAETLGWDDEEEQFLDG